MGKGNREVTKVMKRIGGISLMLYPVVLMIAFALHFQSISEFFIFKFKYVQVPVESTVNMLMGPGAARNFITPHLIAYFSIPFMALASLALGYVLFKKKPLFALIGTLTILVGSVFISGVFAAWLSFSAIGNMPMNQFDGAVSAFRELTTMQGPLAIITYLSVLSLLGFLVLALGLFQSRIVPKWSASLIFIGHLMVIVFMDLDNWMLIGMLLALIGVTPVVKLLLKES